MKWRDNQLVLFVCGCFVMILAVIFFYSVDSENGDVLKKSSPDRKAQNTKIDVPQVVPSHDIPKIQEEGCQGEDCTSSSVVWRRLPLELIQEDTSEPEGMILRVSVTNPSYQGMYVSSQLCSIHTSLYDSESIDVEIFENCDVFMYKMDGAFRSYTEEYFVDYVEGGEIELFFEFLV